MLTVGSLFSGIGGIDLALERAGMKVIWNCENDVNCRKVLAHHWPGIPRFKDVRTVDAQSLRTAGLVPDVIVGGFPCQDVSVARLTPMECLRLQGFPDTWLDLKLPDSIKYRMVGNAVAVPVVEWLGRRLESAHSE